MKLKSEIRELKSCGKTYFYAVILCFEDNGDRMPYEFFSLADAIIGKHSLYYISSPWWNLSPRKFDAVPLAVVSAFNDEWKGTLDRLEKIRINGGNLYKTFYDAQFHDRNRFENGCGFNGTDNRGVYFEKNVIQTSSDRVVEREGGGVPKQQLFRTFIVETYRDNPHNDGYDYLRLRGMNQELRLPIGHPPYIDVESVKVNMETKEVVQAYSRNLGRNRPSKGNAPIGAVYIISLKGDENKRVGMHGDIFGNLCQILRGGRNKTFFEAVGKYGLRGCRIWISKRMDDSGKRKEVRRIVVDNYSPNCYTFKHDNACGKQPISAYNALDGFKWSVGGGVWSEPVICRNIIEEIKKVYIENNVSGNDKGINIELL